jgi:hypothetical protein
MTAETSNGNSNSKGNSEGNRKGNSRSLRDDNKRNGMTTREQTAAIATSRGGENDEKW